MKHHSPRRAAIAGAIAVASLALAQGPAATNAPVRVEAFTAPSVDLTLAFTVPGLLAEIPVSPGDTVKPDQVLARLDDREAVAQIALYTVRADSSLDVDLARAQLELANTELDRARQAFEQGGMGDFEVKRRELEAAVAKIRLSKAEQDRKEAALTLEQARAAAERALIRAPGAGVVERTLVEVGESVERLQPVMRVVAIDPVRIEAAVPVARAGGIAAGSAARITGIDVPSEFHGVVRRVASVADAASGTILVTIEAPNPDAYAAGARVWVEFP